jgi:hypothetical protein
LIAPGETAQVQILLVEKDVQQLWTNFSRLGQASLDHCKDKFLVQSTLVAPSEGVTAGDYERLTSFWTNVHSSSSPHEAEVHHKKFPVRHVGVNAGSASTLPVANTTTANNNPMLLAPRSAANATTYSSDAVQLQTELTNLSRKYDELVAFSVNLTAERDILNNTLEQTKRDLNRQLQSAAANDNRNAGGNAGGIGGSGGSGTKKGGRSILSLLSTLFLLAVTASASWLLGCYMQGRGQTYFIQDIPKVGHFLHQHIHPGVPLKPVADDDDDEDDDDEDATHEL